MPNCCIAFRTQLNLPAIIPRLHQTEICAHFCRGSPALNCMAGIDVGIKDLGSEGIATLQPHPHPIKPGPASPCHANSTTRHHCLHIKARHTHPWYFHLPRLLHHNIHSLRTHARTRTTRTHTCTHSTQTRTQTTPLVARSRMHVPPHPSSYNHVHTL